MIMGSARLHCKLSCQQIPVVCSNGTVVPYSDKVKKLRNLCGPFLEPPDKGS